MIIKRIKLENIRSFLDAEIFFNEGSTLLAGDIGSGKTSILLAIEFALFGLQPGQRGSALLSNKAFSGSVTMDFNIDGKEITIERKLKRTNKSVNQESASITLDGKKIESSVTEIKSHILSILNYPDEFLKKNNVLYKYTVYTPQEQMKQIILDDLETRLDSLRYIFGVDKFKRIKNNLSIISSKIKEEIKLLNVEVKSLDDLKSASTNKELKVNSLSEVISKKNSSLQEAILIRKNTEKEVQELESKVKEKERFIQEIEKSNILLSAKSQTLSQEKVMIKELESKILESSYKFDESSYKSLINDIALCALGIEEINKNYLGVISKISSLEMIKEKNTEKRAKIFKIDFCPTCLQNVSENHKHNIMNETESEIVKVNREQELLFKQKEELEKILMRERKYLQELESAKKEMEIKRVKSESIENSKEKLEIYKKSYENLVKDVDFLKNHVKNLKEYTLEFTKFDNLLSAKRQELKEAFRSEKNVEIEIAELKKESELTVLEINFIKEKIKELEKSTSRLIRLMELERWLSENFVNLIDFTEKSILYKLKIEFSRIFNKWFSLLTTDSFYVQLDENFSPVITQGDFETDYAYLSGGERTAIALAYRLSLNQILNSLLSNIKTKGLIILDEPTDGFSDQQLDKVRDILHELNAKQLIIVSHEQKIESFVDNIIRLKKDSGISRVVS